MTGRQVLQLMGWQPHAARTQALRFRQHTIDLIEAMQPHVGDEQKLVAVAQQGRQQLEHMWAQEREQREADRQRMGWSQVQAADKPDPP